MKIYYDGDCYFCTNYVQLLRLREAVHDVDLVSLRSKSPDVERILASHININTGFVVEHGGQTYHGAQAFHYLNTLIEPRNFVNRALFSLGRHEKLSRLIYPALVAGRYALLVAQGRSLIDSERPHDSALPAAITEGEPFGARTVRLAALLIAVLGLVRFCRVLVRQESLYSSLTLGVVSLVAASVWILTFVKGNVARTIFYKIRESGWRGFLCYFTVWMLVVNSFDQIAARRISGFLLTLPLIWIATELFQKYRNQKEIGVVPAAIPLAMLIFSTLPGLYLAPFYGGIAGWTLSIDYTSPVVVNGYKLVNRHGGEVWYNHAFFQPITMDGRFERSFRMHNKDRQQFMKFMMDNYVRIYPELEQGRMPQEWALGRFSYPTHNLSDSNARDYAGSFAPGEIVEIRRVSEHYSREGVFIKSVTNDIYSVSNSSPQAGTAP